MCFICASTCAHKGCCCCLFIYFLNRDPANVKNLIQNSYANDWIAAHQATGNYGIQTRASGGGKGIPLTRATEGHAFGAHTKYLVPDETREPFKMSKFKNIPAKTSTRRSQ